MTANTPPILGAIDVEVFQLAHRLVGVDRRCAGLRAAGDANDQSHPACRDNGAGYAGCPKGPGPGSHSTASVPKAGLVDINSATAAELKGLPGVSDADSAKIIQGRPYADTNQLVSRHVVSEATYDKIKDHVVAKQPKS